jgi:beta-xylosidase
VTWVDGWPILGKVGSDGVGGMVWKRAMPIAGFPATTLSQSDEFNGPDLKPAWEWRYQPRPDGWSLSAHPGFLRLYASGALRPDDFNAIPDVLTQRSLRTRHSEATVRLDLSGMVDDQEAGIAHFAKTYATLTITQNRGIRRLSFNRDGVRTAGPQVQTRTVYLRSSWTADGQSQFSYSTDGRSFHQAGVPYPLTWGSYRGDRIGLFSVGSQPSSGYVDVDFFHYLVQR